MEKATRRTEERFANFTVADTVFFAHLQAAVAQPVGAAFARFPGQRASRAVAPSVTLA
jgi:hypothetical protein